MASILQNTNDLQTLRDQMNRTFSPDNEASRIWAPAVDVAENEREIVLHAELPGMKKEDIDIQLTGDTLTLRGERKRESSTRSEHYHRLERQYGAWQRIFQIETPVDAQNVAANYEQGVLTIRLPKQAAAQPRQIEIQSK
ncbi:MAG TPA: Hsp20/alpha crystallin family protein [Abditibacteriaceae bacterium]|nr:Hsp20/alpha crystallin family protein [Abditibacteriaceae bacterium]